MSDYTKFFILNQSFETVYYISHYESILWVDRYDECGDFEIICPPSYELLQYAQQDNYIWSSNSNKLMIIEKIEMNYDTDEGIKWKISGRSLESILDRRIFLYKTVVTKNLEDSIRQILDVSFIKPVDTTRKFDSLIFEYSHNAEINKVEVDYEFEKGTDLLEAITEMVQNAGLGFQITLNDSNQFIFKITVGTDRSYDQDSNPWIIFSPKFNNLTTNSFSSDGGKDYRNFIYCEGEAYNGAEAKQITYGSTTGLARREYYESASDIRHETSDINGTKTTLTEDQYMAQLNQRASDVYKKNNKAVQVDSEVEAKVNNVYGKDYFIGDIVQVEDSLGFTGKVRVSEFITSYSTSGMEMYPTFTGIEEDE